MAIQDLERRKSLERRLSGGRKEEEERRSVERRSAVEWRLEEVEKVPKLQARLRQEQQRWDRECQARLKQQVGTPGRGHSEGKPGGNESNDSEHG